MGRSLIVELCVVALAVAFAAPAASAEQVENPAYKRWKDVKVGTWVKLQGAVQGGPGGVVDNPPIVVMTHKLLEVTSEKAVVETTVVIKMMGREEMPRPSEKHEIPAMVDADKADLGELARNPEVRNAKTAVKKGEEVLDVMGKKLKCSWVDVTITQPQRTINVKSWHTADIPGGLVQTDTKSGTTRNIMKLVEFEVAK